MSDETAPQETEEKLEIKEEDLERTMQQTSDPMEAAAIMFGLYAPKFHQGMAKLGVRARDRVYRFLFEYPLNEKPYSACSPQEKQLMSIGHAVLEAKFLMIMATYNQNLNKLVKAADAGEKLTDAEIDEILKKSPDELDTATEA